MAVKKVGIQFVAEGLQEYITGTQQAADAEKIFIANITDLGATFASTGAALDQYLSKLQPADAATRSFAQAVQLLASAQMGPVEGARQAAWWEEALKAREAAEQESAIKQAQIHQQLIDSLVAQDEAYQATQQQQVITQAQQHQQLISTLLEQDKAYDATRQQQVIAQAQQNQQVIDALIEQDKVFQAQEQENVVKTAQARTAYIQLWTEALDAREAKARAMYAQLVSDEYRYQQLIANMARSRGGTPGDPNFVPPSFVGPEGGAGLIDWTEELNQKVAENAKVTDEAAGAHHRLSLAAVQASRSFFALTLASFGLMTISRELAKVFGDEVAQGMQKVTDVFQIVASFGSAGAFLGSAVPGLGGAAGGVAGGVVGLALGLTTAMVQLDPAVEKVNQQLDTLAKKDEVASTLADINGWTRETADAMLELAKDSPKAAQALEDLARAREPLSGFNRVLGGIGDALGSIKSGIEGIPTDWAAGIVLSLQRTAPELYNVVRIFAQWNDASRNAAAGTAEVNLKTEEVKQKGKEGWEEITKALDTYNDKIVDTNARLERLMATSRQQYAEAQYARDKAIADAEQTFKDTSDKAWRSLKDKWADNLQQLNDQRADIEQNLGDRLADIDSQLADKRFDASQTYADRLYDIDANLNQKLADARAKFNQARIDEEKRVQDRLWEIQRDRLRDLEQLDYNTHKQLSDAKTLRAREDIEKDALFQRGMINQRHDDQVEALGKESRDKLAQARRDMEDTLAIARREAEQQREIAEREFRQNVERAEREARQQRSVAQREAQEQLDRARRTYDEQNAIARRAYDENVADAKLAEDQKKRDAVEAWHQRTLAIAAELEIQRAEVERTRKDAEAEYQKILDKVDEWIIKLLVLKGLSQELAWAFLGLLENPSSFDPSQFNRRSPYTGQTGFEMDVNRPTYILAGEGYQVEHVSVQPVGGGSSTSYTDSHNRTAGPITINIYEANNPAAVRRTVLQTLQDEAFR